MLMETGFLSENVLKLIVGCFYNSVTTLETLHCAH